MASSSSKASFQLVLPVFLVFLAEYCISLEATLMANSGVFKVACIAEERKALLKFKQGLKDSSGRLSSWVGEDCCKWMGVGCSNQTGNVIKLDLSNPSFSIKESKASTDPMRQCLGGELDPSLLNLTSLNYLDLSYNNFQGIPIPSFIGSLKKLRYLDLSQSSFGGMVPPHLGNLSNLLHLDLTTHSYPLNPWVSDLNWVSSLSSLQYLGLGGVNLSMTTTHWLPAVHMLPSLLELHLSGCHLDDLPQSLPYLNFTSLLVVDLSYNYFNTSLPPWLFNISTLVTVNLKHGKFTGSIPEMAWKSSHCSLQSFDLSANSVSGQVEEFVEALSRCSNSSLKMLDFSFNNIDGILPESLGSLKHLETLRFRANSLSGPIPTTIGNLSHLQDLDLSFNMMSGTIPESIGQLTRLRKLYLRGIRSSWKGIISEVHFENLTNLAIFSISSFNSLVFHISPEWLPVFNLYSLSISDCQLMTPAFPAWLRTQTSLSKIILINVGISDTIPNWFWRKSPNDYFWSLDHVDLSNNQLRGQLPDSIDFLLGTFINLNNNCLEGSLPLWPTVTTLRLASNRFSGPIPLNIGQEMPYMRILELSWNYLNGTIPTSISKMENLTAVDLSSNYLSGYIPNDWKGLQKLSTIDFSNNNLFGQIPSSMCSQLPALKWLRLSNNNLSGELKTSLQRCEMLFTLDLRENKFSGTIPKWIGENLHGLSYLLLGANMFTGNMPQQICDLPYLQVLNLSHNNLSGSIPRCMGNLEQMKHRGNTSALATFLNMMYPNLQHMDLKVKGDMGYEYYHILSLINSIDLSTNNLRGEIPEEIANLSALGSLNLSRNQLTGKIPEGFGRLQLLETLDLSINRLWGPIPLDMTSMTSLSKLNLSYNNLSGPIPSTNQFHTLNDPTIYEGNSGLCGPPLTTQCSTSNDEDPKVKEDADEDRSGKIWLYVSTSLGFIVGFWAVFGSLVIKRSWRHAYFQFLDKMKDRLSFW